MPANRSTAGTKGCSRDPRAAVIREVRRARARRSSSRSQLSHLKATADSAWPDDNTPRGRGTDARSLWPPGARGPTQCSVAVFQLAQETNDASHASGRAWPLIRVRGRTFASRTPTTFFAAPPTATVSAHVAASPTIRNCVRWTPRPSPAFAKVLLLLSSVRHPSKTKAEIERHAKGHNKERNITAQQNTELKCIERRFACLVCQHCVEHRQQRRCR